MFKQGNLIIMLIIVLFCLVACTGQTTSNNFGSATPREDLSIEPTSAAPMTVTPSPTRNVTTLLQPTPALTSTPTQNPTVTISPFSTTTRSVIQKQGCPMVVDKNMQLLTQGSILYNVGKIQLGYPPNDIFLEKPGIWSFSSVSQSSYQVYAFGQWGWVSPDGIFLLNFVPDVINQKTTATLLNLETNESYDLVIPRAFEQISPEWLSNDVVQLKVIVEQEEGIGELLEIYVLNLNERELQREVKEISLPDFSLAEIGIMPGVNYGYISIDPTNRFALYTTSQGQNQNIEIRLRDLQTNEVIWQKESGIVSAGLPEWSWDSNKVLFDIGVHMEGEISSWSKLVSLNTDGREEDLPPQPFPYADEYLINQYSRSPNGRYIFYLVLFSEGFTQTSRAFILDTETWQVSEICSPDTNFLAYTHGGGTEVYWLPNDQLIYRALISKDGQQTHSLRILDIPSWTAQVLFEAQPGYGINVFGWTSSEFPEIN